MPEETCLIGVSSHDIWCHCLEIVSIKNKISLAIGYCALDAFNNGGTSAGYGLSTLQFKHLKEEIAAIASDAVKAKAFFERLTSLISDRTESRLRERFIGSSHILNSVRRDDAQFSVLGPEIEKIIREHADGAELIAKIGEIATVFWTVSSGINAILRRLKLLKDEDHPDAPVDPLPENNNRLADTGGR